MTGLTMICIILQITMEVMIPFYLQSYLVMPLFKRWGWLSGIMAYLSQVILLIFFLPYILNGVGMVFRVIDRVDWRNEHIAFSIVIFTLMATVCKLALDGLIRDKQQKENELRHLKEQLNPHFLFNTLNNLYGLSVTASPQLPELMLQLSELLRYSLYQTNQAYVPLKKELDYISNYVALERIRLSGKVDIQMEITGNYTDLYIAPLLLIIFVENGFKHFSSPDTGRAYIHIQLHTTDSRLQLNIKNSVDNSHIQSKTHGGLGLKNVKQRLSLIYLQKHSLEITNNACFEVKLAIDLN